MKRNLKIVATLAGKNEDEIVTEILTPMPPHKHIDPVSKTWRRRPPIAYSFSDYGLETLRRVEITRIITNSPLPTGPTIMLLGNNEEKKDLYDLTQFIATIRESTKTGELEIFHVGLYPAK